MTFGEKLKSLRKTANLSQEQFADKIGVSRQAVTKWECDAGMPDLSNLAVIAKILGVTVDALLDEGGNKKVLYESTTEYDVDGAKLFDIKLGCLKEVHICGYEGEKFKLQLSSDTYANLQQDFKIKIDDRKTRMDIDIKLKKDAAQATAKQEVCACLFLPQKYTQKLEVSLIADKVEAKNLSCDSVELDAKAAQFVFDGVCGHAEINCNIDTQIFCKTLPKKLDVNQISATSNLFVPQDASFCAKAKGTKTKIFYLKGCNTVESLSTDGADCEIELNGLNSQLTVCAD